MKGNLGVIEIAFDKKTYNAEYQKKNTVQVKMSLVRSTDADILSWLEKQPNKQGYIKSLIRADMAKSKR